MVVTALFKGFIAGALVAIPIGPIGILCLRRMLTQGALIGIVSGFGGATADIIFATIAAAGLSIVSSFVIAHSIIFRVISSIFLLVIGGYIYFHKPHAVPGINGVPSNSRGIWQAYFSTLFLTLTNPLLIISFAALLAWLDLEFDSFSYMHLFSLLTGIFLGSSLWWFLLGIITTCYPVQINASTIQVINRWCGILIIMLSLLSLLSIAIT